MSRPSFKMDTLDSVKVKIRIPTCLCSEPSPSDTIDNIKAKIQDGYAPVFEHRRRRQGQDPRHGSPPISAASPHLRTPLTTSRPRSKTDTCPSLNTIDNVKAKIQDMNPCPASNRATLIPFQLFQRLLPNCHHTCFIFQLSSITLLVLPLCSMPLPLDLSDEEEEEALTHPLLPEGLPFLRTLHHNVKAKIRIPTCLCSEPSPSDTIDNVKAKIQGGYVSVFEHQRRRQGQDPRWICARLRTPPTTSSP
jgi:hypothetical protein